MELAYRVSRLIPHRPAILGEKIISTTHPQVARDLAAMAVLQATATPAGAHIYAIRALTG